MWVDEAQGRFDEMNTELEEINANMDGLETAKDDAAGFAADAGYDPDYEYVDWSTWEEGDATGTDWTPPEEECAEGDEECAAAAADDGSGDDAAADDGSGDGSGDGSAAAAAGGESG